MILAHRIQLNLNNVQRTWFTRCAGAARFIFNWGLARWKELYAAGEKPHWQELNKELNTTKPDWLRELPWKIPNQALEDLGAAFANFFRRTKVGDKPGYPRFKKRGRCREGFAIEARALTLDGCRIKLPKLGWIKMRETLRFPGKILSARFSRRADHWYVSLQVEVDKSWVYPNGCKTQAAVGVDLGVIDLAVLSTGERVGAPRVLRLLAIQMRRLNKELSRRKSGGRNREKTRTKLARLHEQIANIRRDVTHKLTARLVRRFRWIGIEDLNVRGMIRNHHLAKSVADAAMAEVRRQLEYKAPLAGGTVVVADRWFPSSKTCSACGLARDALPLSIRHWTCECGADHDRDVNAAKNLEALAVAHTVTACRQGSSGVNRKIGVKLPLGQESSGCANYD